MSDGVDNGYDDGRIGELLERVRREKGLSLHDVENATKIRTRYLEGLEREDYSALPDTVYVQGFLKTYANYLGLDGDSLAQEFRERRAPRRERGLNYERPRASEFERPIMSPGGLAGAERRRVSGTTILTVVLALILLAIVGGALYYVGSRSAGSARTDGSASQKPRESGPAEPGQRPAREPDPRPADGTSVEGASVAPAGEVPDGAVDVVVNVGERPSWLNVEADGVVVYYQTAPAGFISTFEGREYVSVTAGDAGAVEVEVDGKSVGPLGYDWQTTTQTYTVAGRPVT